MAISIWQTVNQDTFYDRLNKLKTARGECPGRESRYTHSDWKSRGNHDGKNLLNFKDERSWVSNFAFLAASSQEPGGVSAVIVEEVKEERALVFHGAANEGIKEHLTGELSSVLQVLESCASSSKTVKRQ